jgi:hypothetical protein
VLNYQFEHAVQILHYVAILDSQDVKPNTSKKLGPHSVRSGCRLMVMRGPIEFNYQALPWAIEIHYVRPDAVLTPELPAIELRTLQRPPKRCLRQRHTTTERTTLLLEGYLVVELGIERHSDVNAAIGGWMTD